MNDGKAEAREAGAKGQEAGQYPVGRPCGAESITAAAGQTKAEVSRLMEAVIERSNVWSAYQKVVRNGGAPGVDGLTGGSFKDWLKRHWPRVEAALLDGSYLPSAVRAVARHVDDVRVLKLIRRYLEAGLMRDGVEAARDKGTPQGGPLSPLLSNILLTDWDRELEKRGHAFCRYADDCNIYVRSEAAGQRVMASMQAFLEERLQLQVNAAKSACARPWERKFLGYTLTNAGGRIRLKVALQSVACLTSRVRELLRQGRGRSLTHTIETLNPVLRGWVGYFQLSESKKVWKELDGWLRRRLRCLLPGLCRCIDPTDPRQRSPLAGTGRVAARRATGRGALHAVAQRGRERSAQAQLRPRRAA